MIFAGIDPDIHVLSMAMVDENRELLGVHVTKASGFKGLAAAAHMIRQFRKDIVDYVYPADTLVALAVEGQDVGYTGRTNAANPQDLIPLAAVAGGALAAVYARRTYFVKPNMWKGSVPKKIHQRRTLSKVGLLDYKIMGGASPYPVPNNYKHLILSGKVNDSDWKDINDSIGLALYARERYMKEEKR